MLLGGDEIGRTQLGNNNAYCQDNEISWYDWEHADEDLLAFTRRRWPCATPTLRCAPVTTSGARVAARRRWCSIGPTESR